jgi:hypothetical protein
VSLDLAYDDGQQAIRDALEQFCSDRCGDEVVKALAGRFPDDLWRELCDLGVLDAATPEGEGGALELAAAMEALGRWVVPGPWAASVLAARLLDPVERKSVARGELVVSAGTPPLMPWATRAGIFLELTGERVWLLRSTQMPRPVETLGGEVWGMCTLERERELEGAAMGLALHDVAHAAYLAAAGERLLEATADHARARVQFGRAIGEFQAVAHPLADCSMRLSAAATLARAAAWRLDAEQLPMARVLASGARLSADGAALETAHVCHQMFGAVGITLEGPAYHFTRRIRQLASQPPGAEPARRMILSHFEMPASPGEGAS